MISKILYITQRNYMAQSIRYGFAFRKNYNEINDEKKFSRKIKDCQSMQELKGLYEQNKQTLTQRNYSEICRRIPKTIQKFKSIAKVPNKSWIIQIIEIISRWKPQDLSAQYVETIVFFQKILIGKNFHKNLISQMINKLISSKHIKEQLETFELRRIANIYHDLYMATMYSSIILKILLKKLQQLSLQIASQDSLQKINYQDISQIMVRILTAIINGQNKSDNAQFLCQQIINILVKVWDHIEINQLARIVYILNSSYILNFKKIPQDVDKSIKDKIFNNLAQFDTQTVFFILEELPTFNTKFQDDITFSIAQQFFGLITPDQESSIDTVTFFRCLRLLCRKKIPISIKYLPQFEKFVVQSLKFKSNLYTVESSLVFLIDNNFFQERQFLQMIYKIVKTSLSIKWSIRLLRALHQHDFDINEILKRNYQITSLADHQFIRLATLLKQINNKDTSLTQIQQQVQYKLNNMTPKQLEQFIKIDNPELLEPFHKYYKHLFIDKIESEIKQKSLTILQNYIYQYICKFQTAQQQQKLLSYLDNQKKQIFVKKWSHFIQDNFLFTEFHIKSFFHRLKLDFSNKSTYNKFTIISLLKSYQLKDLLIPSNHQFIQIYMQLLEIALTVQCSQKWAIIFTKFLFGQSNMLYYLEKTPYLYKLMQKLANKPNLELQQTVQKTLGELLIGYNIPKHDQLLKIYENTTKKQYKNIWFSLKEPLRQQNFISSHLQLKKSLSQQQIAYVNKKLPSMQCNEIAEILIKFNLQKSKQSQMLLENIVNYAQKCFSSQQLHQIKILPLLDNMKTKVNQGYSKEIFNKILNNFVQKLNEINMNRIFLQQQLYLLQQYQQLRIVPKMNGLYIGKLQKMIMKNCKYSKTLLERGQKIFKSNNWAMKNENV